MNYYASFLTEIGTITIVCNDDAVLTVDFGDPNTNGAEKKETPLLQRAKQQLIEYMEGERNSFDLPLDPKGTEFQKKVWQALRKIPYGETRSYKEVAVSLGNPGACRAVGMANNKNPIPIFIPCHRVIGADGSLVGYGGGLDIKVHLLNLEQPGEHWKIY